VTAVTAISRPVSFHQSKSSFISVVALTALLYIGDALAIEQIEIELGRLSAADWSLQDAILHLTLGEEGGSSSLYIHGSKLSHPALSKPVEKFRLECAQGEIRDEMISCSGGRFTANLSAKESLSFPLEFEASSSSGQWQLRLDAKGVDIRRTQRLFALAGGTRLRGKIDLSLEMSGSSDVGVTALNWNTKMHNLSFSDTTGEYLGEKLYGRLQGGAKLLDGSWEGSQQIKLQQGAILTPALFVSPEGHQISTKFGFSWSNESERLVISNLDYRHQEVFTATASATINFHNSAKIQRVKVKTGKADIPAVYTAYLQPVLAGTLLENLELAGEGKLELELGRGGQHRVDLQLDDLFMEDRGGRFAAYGLNGRLVSTVGRKTQKSNLSWEGGKLLGGLKFGRSSTVLQLQDGGVELLEPLLLPLLDGSLQVDSFSLVSAKDGPQVKFQGSVAPISMQAISQALDWPPLAGELSGIIPSVSYEKGRLVVDGEMLIRLFSGDVKINNLFLEDMFGALPRVRADVDMQGLDLETLTRTFSFGKITGKLQGYIHKLYLEAWRPVSFDARFETPEDDDSKHRISQRAVENISNLGGAGVSGAISRTFLRMFKEFGYSRLGISCRLQQGVCAMGGIEPAEKGYYIVRGGGVPRIDIIGFNQNTDWEILVNKLQDISRNSEPVIK
jgi:hypothetical protein